MRSVRSRRSVRRAGGAIAGMLASAALIAACGGSAHVSLASSSQTSATYALPPNSPPFYIMPLTPLNAYNGNNSAEFQWLMYRPLYWFGNHGTPALNPSLSLAAAPTYVNSGRTAVIRLKNYMWSDGKPVTSRDVIFFINLLRVAKDNWADYVPGAFPDNVTAAVARGPRTVAITFNRPYNPNWLLYNELSQITPMPQQAWDKTSPTGKVGNYDMTPAGAKRVYEFLLHEGSQLATYTTNPLWKIVDGPWKLESFNSSDAVTFVPNEQYSGPTKPSLKTLKLVPFTSDTAEFNVLRGNGNIDYGYVPPEDFAQLPQLRSEGFRIVAAPTWSINFIVPNYNNPTIGPLVKQLYIRQAMELLVDQGDWVKTILHGFGNETTGPVPLEPPSPFVSALERQNPYPFDPKRAEQLLRQHGWHLVPNGVSTCERPGSGAGECGAGIGAGAKLQFNLQYANGIASLNTAMQAVQSNFSEAGIKLNLEPEPLQTVNANEVRCTPAQAKCAWQLVEGNYLGWTYEPDFYPSGGQIFAQGGGSNSGGYYNPTAQRLIEATHLSRSPTALTDYENYMAVQLPGIWLPVVDNIVAVRSNLLGTQPTDPFGSLYAEDWHWAK
jgi:peptide/nickel transport system substrate-binding protein